MYFGSDENLAGESAGQRIADAGGKNPLCVIQAAGSVALEARCAGVKSKAPNTKNIQVNGADDSAVVSSLQAKLSQDKTIDYIVTLGAPIALDALKAMDAAGSKAKLITFDLNIDAAKAIKDGKIEFSIDQQPYVQGYHGRHGALPEQEERQRHRRWWPGPDRPFLRGQDEHRHHPSVRPEEHPLATRGLPSRTGTTEVLMSQTSENRNPQKRPARSPTGYRSACSAGPWADRRSVPWSPPS